MDSPEDIADMGYEAFAKQLVNKGFEHMVSYIICNWPYNCDEIKTYSRETIANKGYESFAEHFVNEKIKKKETEIAARDSRREDYLRSQNISEDVIAAMKTLKYFL